MNDVPILGIEEIALEVKDLGRSIAFYQSHRTANVFARDAVGLVSSRDAAARHVHAGSRRQRAVLRVSDLTRGSRVRSACAGAHGFPEETMQQDGGLSLYVRDSDGNKIELYGKRLAT